MKTTTINLPIDLAAIVPALTSTSQKETLATIVAKAKANEYHCFKSPHATPKIILVSQLALLMPHTQLIIDAVKNGDYDEQPT